MPDVVRYPQKLKRRESWGNLDQFLLLGLFYIHFGPSAQNGHKKTQAAKIDLNFPMSLFFYHQAYSQDRKKNEKKSIPEQGLNLQSTDLQSNAIPLYHQGNCSKVGVDQRSYTNLQLLLPFSANRGRARIFVLVATALSFHSILNHGP